jgi:hypothetical protein
MSILNVNQIQPVGSGQTITISATNIDTGSATFTGSSSATFNNGLNVTGGSVGIGTDSPVSGVKLHLQDTSACRIQLSTDNTGHTSSDGVRLMIDSSNNFEILNRENASIEFFTNNTQRWSINSTGNLVAESSGLGIDFSATSDGSGTSTSELLDDYEEGSWTPTLTDSSQANVYSSGTRYGYYTKVGRMVTATAVFDNATCVAGNSVKVGGLPYTITSTTTRYPGFNSHTTGAAISGTTIQGGYARPGETNFQLLQQNSFSTVNFSSGAFNMFLTFIYVV